MALLSGDLDLARRLATLPAAGQVGRNLQGAISVVEGRYDEALEQFAATDKKRFSGRAGICGILHVLALVRRARPEDLDLARRLATVGARKDDPFYRTHGILRDVVEGPRSCPGTQLALVSERNSSSLKRPQGDTVNTAP